MSGYMSARDWMNEKNLKRSLREVDKMNALVILGHDDLPGDTCSMCHKVMTNNDVIKYGRELPVICSNCRKE
jgi:hypothetical protein